ncbi:MAG: chromate efflux transporter [Betaproteobacteria bacterium]
MAERQHSVAEVFRAFSRLGFTSFGGPIAHLAYFRDEFVSRRNWVTERQYAQLVALCQFLPGPASSQLGFSLGLLRAGWSGALAAFVAFTLPSALLLFAFAALLPFFTGSVAEAGIHGLKLVAVPVVAHGLIGMARQLCPDAARATIAAFGAVAALTIGHAWSQILVVILGAAAGVIVCRGIPPAPPANIHVAYGARMGWFLITLFAALLIALPVAATAGGLLAVADAFYRAGALVFGGGHVVLPLLEQAVVAPGWMTQDEFLVGYGGAQAVPGPMFTLAAYLGARIPGAEGGLAGSVVALLAIFLPGFLLVAGVLPLWSAVAARPNAGAAIAGINAAVVGLLGAAFYDPVWTTAITASSDMAIAILGFVLLAAWRVSALCVVAWCVLASVAAASLQI